ncbi:MAG: hypothetical protein AAF939_19490, partial [Planctomycetota bacterium]
MNPGLQLKNVFGLERVVGLGGRSWCHEHQTQAGRERYNPPTGQKFNISLECVICDKEILRFC